MQKHSLECPAQKLLYCSAWDIPVSDTDGGLLLPSTIEFVFFFQAMKN